MERTAATSPAPTGRTAARWAVLCALLLGLFLMHGSPASAAGCHPETVATAHGAGLHGAGSGGAGSQAAGSYAAVLHDAGPQGAGLPEAEPAGTVAGGRQVVNLPMRQGSSAEACVSIQARDRVSPAAPATAAAPWTHPRPPGAAAPAAGGRAGEGRAPPGGRELLLRVCVARR
ncbi:hypothetical protein [Kitasatospora sp. NPDC088134]|uniref:hypothetical protein n=1 Tax=Kitasatospora sp. NPDC088134 TaxID=3364071 RepID=UPI00380A5B43